MFVSEAELGRISSFQKSDVSIRPALLMVCLLPCVLLGIARLPETFTGDQAMFVVYAERLSNGGMLYTDIWDVKQPGIFLFYLAGGTLFAFSEYGIHLFELLYWLLFAVVCLKFLRDYFSNNWLVYFVPMFTVGYYYLTAGSLQMTQVETLANLPVGFSFLLVPKLAETSGRLCWFVICLISGLSITATIILKIAFLPLVVAVSVVAVILTSLRHPKFGRAKALITFVVIWAICGVSLFLCAFWIDHLGVLEQFVYTSFVYPREATALHGGFERIAVLGSSLVWFTVTFLPLLATIAIGCIFGLSKAFRADRGISGLWEIARSKPNVVTACLLVWIAVGSCVILIQTTSWWSYHFMLLLTPLGILALKAIDHLLNSIESLRKRRLREQFTIIFLFQVAMLSAVNVFTVREIKRLYRDRNYGYENSMLGPYGDHWDQYQRVLEESRMVGDTNIRDRSMFVCSDPLYYFLNRQTPAISTNGWMPEFFVERQWRIFEEEVTGAKPDLLVVDSDCEWLIAENSVRLKQQFENEYEVILRSEKATWLRRAERVAPGEPKLRVNEIQP